MCRLSACVSCPGRLRAARTGALCCQTCGTVGAIEQDADGVLFLYRDDYYTGGPVDGQPSAVELTVAKNRHGQTGETSFNLWLKYSYFKEAEQ